MNAETMEAPTMAQEGIRPYGPGKFDHVIDQHVYELSLNGCDDVVGDVFEHGVWYGIIRGSFNLALPFGDFTPQAVAAMTDEESKLLKTCAGVIIREDSQGFVFVEYYGNADNLEADWRDVQREIDAANEAEPC